MVKKNIAVQDVVRLYCFALIIQLLLLVPYLLKAHERAQSAHQVILRLCDTLTFAAPPGLPSLLMLVGFVARRRSRKDGLQLMYPEILKRGAACDVVCFDKTGTLTHSAVSAPGTYFWLFGFVLSCTSLSFSLCDQTCWLSKAVSSPSLSFSLHSFALSLTYAFLRSFVCSFVHSFFTCLSSDP